MAFDRCFGCDQPSVASAAISTPRAHMEPPALPPPSAVGDSQHTRRSVFCPSRPCILAWPVQATSAQEGSVPTRVFLALVSACTRRCTRFVPSLVLQQPWWVRDTFQRELLILSWIQTQLYPWLPCAYQTL